MRSSLNTFAARVEDIATACEAQRERDAKKPKLTTVKDHGPKK